jgi:uncharacterized protein (TIGR04551 family)
MLRPSLAAPIAVALALSPALAFGQGAPGTTGPGTTPPSPPATGAPPSGGRAPSGAAPIDRGQLLEPSAPPRTGAPATAPAATPAEPKETDRTRDASIGANPHEIYAEDWWVRSHPVLEFHGYLRVRAELFHGFALGRIDSPDNALWPQPADNSYTDAQNNPHNVALCGDNGLSLCDDKSQAGANMRFRINPELHVSDNLRILSQIDMLDNLVLGSTPGGYANRPSATSATGYQTVNGTTYVPIGGFATTQVPPTAGINSFKNSIEVKRAWGEYATPLGQLRFGRQPSHWGLGILENAGDTYDSDWQSTVDRIMFTTGIKSADLYFSGAWDFPNEGATSATLESLTGGQPYDLAQLDDVNQYVAMIARRRDPELAKLDLAKDKVVLNGGAYFSWRDQYLGSDNNAANNGGSAVGDNALGSGTSSVQQTYIRRSLHLYTPDLWFQLLFKKFRFEAEGVLVAGNARTVSPNANVITNTKFEQWGLATQTEFRAIEDRLRLGFGFGWASGDQGLLPTATRATTLSPTRIAPSNINGPRLPGTNTYTEYRFHPDYRVDLIFWREIIGRVEGGYYFRPSVDYDFTRTPEGQKLGGGASVIWSRASEFIQTPGHKRDLGLEFDLSLYFQSKDGSLNDNPDRMGGFFTMVQYGVFFPFGGLNHLSSDNPTGTVPDTTTAHAVRWFIGVLY